MRIVSVVGARPQFIKAAVVSRALRSTAGVSEILVHTGQHYDQNMSQIFFEELAIPEPDYNLDIGSGSHGSQTGRMLEAIEAVLIKEAPDWVLVYGDTNSTLAGALAAAKLNIAVAHVEAGLRSFNRTMPEEINRILVDHVSSLLLAPTPLAVQNHVREGVPARVIRLTGDVMFDAALHYGPRARRPSELPSSLVAGEYILATVHRAENTDAPATLTAIAGALQRLSSKFPVVFPMHPRTRGALARLGISADAQGPVILDPVGYLEMIWLQKNARLVVTDSGGMQKEAFFQGVPCATLRGETEWQELVDAGWNALVPPTDAESLAERLLALACAPRPSQKQPLYGDGRAGELITRELAAK